LREGDALLNTHGNKGSQLWVDITTMQVMAFYGAAVTTKIEGVACRAQIAIPGTTHDHETNGAMTAVLSCTLAVCEDTRHVPGYVECPLGLVIGTPRGCVRADKILSVCGEGSEGTSFLVFDTDQLTELVFGLSKSDSWRTVVRI
jgi:hypothetical protein